MEKRQKRLLLIRDSDAFSNSKPLFENLDELDRIYQYCRISRWFKHKVISTVI